MNTTETIRQYILSQPETIIDLAFLHKNVFPMVAEHSFIKMITRLANEGLIRRIDRGIYAPMTLPDEKLPEAMQNYYIGDASGMLFGDALYNELGLSDKKPECIFAYTNRIETKKRKRVLSYKLTGADIVFDQSAHDLITLLELIENHGYVIALNSKAYSKTVEELCNKDYTENLLKEIISAIPFKDSTVATLRKMLG